MAQLVPAAFAALRQYPQFILWRSIQRGGEDKPAKIPCNANGDPIGVDQIEAFMTAEAAEAASKATGLHLGFVFTERDPFFFLDIDGALRDGAWSSVATELFNSFHGAAFEVSISGTGGHIVGRGAPDDLFKTRAQPYGLELYSHSRFMAFGDSISAGDANTDHSQTLFAVQERFFELRPITEGGDDWTGKRQDCTAPDNDDELIAIMMRHGENDPEVMFGKKLSVRDLWTKNVDKLSLRFPHSDKLFDHSGADQALLNHLAFYTGCDCERMARLFERSELMRPKFKKPYYRRRSIINAVKGRKSVYDFVRESAAPSADQNAVNGVILRPNEQVDFFEGCVYISDRNEVWTSRGLFLSPFAFKNTYSNREFVYTPEGKTTRDAFVAFTQNQCVDFPKADRTCFKPALPRGAFISLENGQSAVNVFDSRELGRLIVPASDADVLPFFDHLARLFPVPRDRLLLACYMAACVQFRGTKFRWCPFIQGGQGNGKSTLLEILGFCQGSALSHSVKSSELGDSSQRFNGWLENKLVYLVDEVYIEDRKDIMDTLKPWITSERLEIQHKGKDQVTREVCGNFIMASNLKSAVTIRRDDRRFAPFFTAQQSKADILAAGMDDAYFGNYYNWLHGDGLALIHGWLSRFPIPTDCDPRTMSRAPETSSSAEAYELSRTFPEQLLCEAIAEGQPGTREGWLTMTAAKRILKEARVKAPDSIARIIEDLGYTTHPNMPQGRPSKNVAGIGRARMWVLPNSAAFHAPDPISHYLSVEADLAAGIPGVAA